MSCLGESSCTRKRRPHRPLPGRGRGGDMGTDLTCCSSEAGWGPGRGGPAPCPGFCRAEAVSAGRRPHPQRSSLELGISWHVGPEVRGVGPSGLPRDGREASGPLAWGGIAPAGPGCPGSCALSCERWPSEPAGPAAQPGVHPASSITCPPSASARDNGAALPWVLGKGPGEDIKGALCHSPSAARRLLQARNLRKSEDRCGWEAPLGRALGSRQEGGNAGFAHTQARSLLRPPCPAPPRAELESI